MGNYSAGGSTDFEWPPRDEVLDREVFRLGDPVAPAASPPASASTTAAPQPHDFEEPHVVLRRAIEAREPKSETLPEPKAASSFPSPGGRLAILALITIAAVQSAYILRTWSGRPLFSAPASEQPAAAPAVESAPPVADRPNDPPQSPKPNLTAATSGREPAPPPATTRLVIRSDPPGARVSIDGRHRGVTPLALNGVAPGEHRLALEREGVEVQQTIRLAAGGTVSVLAPMRPGGAAPGWIALESPIDLDVFEDGALIGTNRSSRILLQAGPHTLQLVNQQLGFRDVRQVQVGAGSVVRIPLELPRSEVLVNASPWAEVWVDGQHVGQTPMGRLSLPIGTYEVVFRHPELGEKKTTAVVRAGAPTRVTVDMRQ